MKKIVIALLFSFSIAANATTYYVKNAGSNSNTGLSDAQAWQTLGHVPWNSLVAGDIVYLNRGDTWREQISITSRSGTSGSWITIQSYGSGAKPKILGSVDGDISGYWTSLGGNLWASANNSFPLETSALYYDTNLSPAKCSANKATQALLTTNWDMFYDASAHRVIVYMSSGSPDTQANGIEIAKPFAATSNEGNVGVRWCNYLSVQDLDIRYCNSYGIKENGGNGGTGSYNTFLNCEVHYTWDKGANFTYGDHMVIDHCIFDHCGYIGLCSAKRSALGSWGETVWVQLNTYPTVRYTEMAYPHNNGIDIWGCSNGLVENCYSHDVDYPLSKGDWETGIYFDGSSNCVARGNRLERLVIGISINAESSGDLANNILCYDNVAVNNDANYQIYCNQGGSNHINNIQFYHNISYHDSPKKYDSGWWAGFYIANCTTIDFKNNIVYNQLGGNHLAFNIASTALSATSDYNDFYLASNSGNFQWNNGGSYSTLAAFTSGTGQDAHSLAVNPSFAAAGSDWHLQTGSGVIGKGIALSATVTDYAGNNWASPPSMGVYESDSNQQPVLPVYTSSVVENATPTIIQMTYNTSLASVVPPVTAFNVQVNSATMAVNSVAIVSGKVQLTLASAIVYSDAVTVAYTAPANNPLQTSSGGLAASIGSKIVTNNCQNSAKSNALPVIVIKNESDSYSGFVYEIDASGSYDADKEAMTYEWIVPKNVSASSTNSSKIQFLAPVVSIAQNFDFLLKVSDGTSTVSKTITINIMPYKPELYAAEITKTEASNIQAPDYANNATDGNLTTKWSANGDNQWITFTLAKSFKISYLEIAFLPGQKFESNFDIYASKDNVNWDAILLNASSCNFSGDIQVFDFPISNINTEYSYIKLVGHGNSVNRWNYISEIKIIGVIAQNSNVSDSENIKVLIYPNPAKDFFNISVEGSAIEPDTFRILDLSGRVTIDGLFSQGAKNIQVQNNLISGVYIVEVRSGASTIDSQRLIINR